MPCCFHLWGWFLVCPDGTLCSAEGAGSGLHPETSRLLLHQEGAELAGRRHARKQEEERRRQEEEGERETGNEITAPPCCTGRV